jgi:hypothetical protein
VGFLKASEISDRRLSPVTTPYDYMRRFIEPAVDSFVANDDPTDSLQSLSTHLRERVQDYAAPILRDFPDVSPFLLVDRYDDLPDLGATVQFFASTALSLCRHISQSTGVNEPIYDDITIEVTDLPSRIRGLSARSSRSERVIYLNLDPSLLTSHDILMCPITIAHEFREHIESPPSIQDVGRGRYPVSPVFDGVSVDILLTHADRFFESGRYIRGVSAIEFKMATAQYREDVFGRDQVDLDSPVDRAVMAAIFVRELFSDIDEAVTWLRWFENFRRHSWHSIDGVQGHDILLQDLEDFVAHLGARRADERAAVLVGIVERMKRFDPRALSLRETRSF